MAPILTIFGPNRSQRRNLFFEKFSNERRRHRGIVVVVIVAVVVAVVAVVGGFWVACIKGTSLLHVMALWLGVGGWGWSAPPGFRNLAGVILGNASKTIIQIGPSGVFGGPAENFRKIFVSIVRLFVCSFVRKFFKF